jgi:hypothetical protein
MYFFPVIFSLISCVADPDHFDIDPHPSFHFATDPDLVFHFGTDPLPSYSYSHLSPSLCEENRKANKRGRGRVRGRERRRGTRSGVSQILYVPCKRHGTVVYLAIHSKVK